MENPNPTYSDGAGRVVYCGSLFAGIGGFDLGFANAGIESCWQVECDKNCNTVLEKHWPDVPRYDDVRTFCNGTADVIRPDIICGGFPCQDLSVAGKRAGLAGERSGLFFEFMRIVGVLSPAWVVIENVPGLLSSNEGRDMAVVLGALGQLGYGFAYRVLDAQWFGVPQRRRRVFIVGCLGDWRRAAKVLFESESLPWDTPPRREKGTRASHCIDGGTGSSGYRYDANGEDFVTARPIKSGGNSRHDESHETYIVATLNSGGNDGGFRTEPGEHIVAYQCHGSNVGPMGAMRSGNGNECGGVPFTFCPLQVTSKDNRTTVRLDGTSGTLHEMARAVAFQTRIARNGRGQPKDITDALTSCEGGTHADSKPHVAGAFGVRRLMPVECERLQGFPDGWTEGLSNSARYRALGNAVAVPVAAWIGKRIKGEL